MLRVCRWLVVLLTVGLVIDTGVVSAQDPMFDGAGLLHRV